MELTREEKKALVFIAARAKSKACASFREVKKALNKRSYSHTIRVLEKLRALGLVEWQPMCRRTLRPTRRGGQILAVTPLYLISASMPAPVKKWRAKDSFWLDPRLFKLNPECKHLVFEAGQDWRPANLKVAVGDRVIVAQPPTLELPDKGRLAMVHLGDKVEAYQLDNDDGWIIKPAHLTVTSKNFIGIVVAVLSMKT